MGARSSSCFNHLSKTVESGHPYRPPVVHRTRVSKPKPKWSSYAVFYGPGVVSLLCLPTLTEPPLARNDNRTLCASVGGLRGHEPTPSGTQQLQLLASARDILIDPAIPERTLELGCIGTSERLAHFLGIFDFGTPANALSIRLKTLLRDGQEPQERLVRSPQSPSIPQCRRSSFSPGRISSIVGSIFVRFRPRLAGSFEFNASYLCFFFQIYYDFL